MPQPEFDFPWQDLPLPLLEKLLIAGAGKYHLLHVAEQALTMATSQDRPMEFLLDFGLDALLAAVEADPLDPGPAAQVLALSDKWPKIPQDKLNLLRAVTAHGATPENAEDFERVRGSASEPEAWNYLVRRMTEPGSEIYWLGRGYELALDTGDWEGFVDLVSALAPLDLSPVQSLCWAKASMAMGEYDRAEQLFNLADVTMQWPDIAARRAECLFRMGEVERARQMYARSLKLKPWSVNTALRLYDLTHGVHDRRQIPDGKTAILVYTYNKAGDLDRTLADLAESDTGNAEIIALNNASTDETQAVLDKWTDRLAGRMQVVKLPVNIGAPAARNWLLSLDGVKNADRVVFMDDDLSLPKDWLGLLGAAKAAYPGAGVYGCRVLGMDRPWAVRGADIHLLEPEPGDKDAPIPVLFQASDILFADPDYGQFSYLRPCVSVTGCLHMITRPALDAVGGFDVRFTPSQYDDLDFDLRLNLAGTGVVCQGHLAVRHGKRTGEPGAQPPGQAENSRANLFTLYGKYSPEEIMTIRSRNLQTLRDDLSAKLARLE